MEENRQKKKARFLSLFLLLGACFLIIIAAEIFLRLAMPIEIHEITGRNYIASRDPELIYELKPLAKGHNSRGWRDYEYGFSKPPDTYRIAVIGDSLAYGLRVPFGNRYAKILERELNRVSGPDVEFQVIDFGVPGYRISQIIRNLRVKVLKYDPDLVIYGYWLDDIYHSIGTEIKSIHPYFNRDPDKLTFERNRFGRIFREFLLKSQIFRRILLLKRDIEYRAEEEKKKDYTAEDLGREVSPEIAGVYGDYLEKCERGDYDDLPAIEPYHRGYADPSAFRELNAGLKEFAEICRAGGIESLLLLTPVIYEHEPGTYAWKDIHRLIGAVARHYSIPILDLREEFEAHPAESLRTRRGDHEHPNRLGHSIIAGKLLDYLTENEDNNGLLENDFEPEILNPNIEILNKSR